VGDGFYRDANGKIRDAQGQFVKSSVTGGKNAGQGFAKSFSASAKAGHLDAVGDALTGIGLVGAAVFAAVKMGMDFDKSMSGIQAATHASAGDMDSLRKAAIKAGADTQFSATEAADGDHRAVQGGRRHLGHPRRRPEGRPRPRWRPGRSTSARRPRRRLAR
jgi:hypothetical protein